MVERGGLENRCALAGTVGSNPTPSATILRCYRYPVGLQRLPILPVDLASPTGNGTQQWNP